MGVTELGKRAERKLTTPSQDLADLREVGTVSEMLFGGV